MPSSTGWVRSNVNFHTAPFLAFLPAVGLFCLTWGWNHEDVIRTFTSPLRVPPVINTRTPIDAPYSQLNSKSGLVLRISDRCSASQLPFWKLGGLTSSFIGKWSHLCSKTDAAQPPITDIFSYLTVTTTVWWLYWLMSVTGRQTSSDNSLI